jgi:hypothetical protein
LAALRAGIFSLYRFPRCRHRLEIGFAQMSTVINPSVPALIADSITDGSRPDPVRRNRATRWPHWPARRRHQLKMSAQAW